MLREVGQVVAERVTACDPPHQATQTVGVGRRRAHLNTAIGAIKQPVIEPLA